MKILQGWNPSVAGWTPPRNSCIRLHFWAHLVLHRSRFLTITGLMLSLLYWLSSLLLSAMHSFSQGLYLGTSTALSLFLCQKSLACSASSWRKLYSFSQSQEKINKLIKIISLCRSATPSNTTWPNNDISSDSQLLGEVTGSCYQKKA